MPPMATPSSSKRKWSDVFTDGDDEDLFDKQSIMDLCSSKLRYVNPARPPRRRTEVPLLRNVLIVNTMKHLSSDLRQERTLVEYTGHSEDLTVDPGHFEGLPPLSELLTDIMLDPQPTDPQQSFNWQSATYSTLAPLEPSIPAAYMDDAESVMEEDKVVHDLLPCTSVAVSGMDEASGWDDETSTHIGSYLSSPSLHQSDQSSNSLDSIASDLAFQSSSENTLPSFTSLFESSSFTSPAFTPTSSYTDLTPVATSSTTTALTVTSSSSTFTTLTSSILPSNEDLVGNTTLTEAELEVLAMAFSSKLPHVSFEELVHAFPPSPRTQPQQQHISYQSSQMSPFYVPSSIQSTNNHCLAMCSGPLSESANSPPPPNNPCGASFYRKDQPQQSVDENMVRVLVNL